MTTIKKQPQQKTNFKPHKKVTETHIGIVDHVDPNHAYIILTDNTNNLRDIKIHQKDLLNAIHEDTVEIQIFPSTKERKQGKVIKIISRKHHTIIGRIEQIKQNHLLCIPDKKRLYPLIIPETHQNCQPNDKVTIQILNYNHTHAKYTGKIINILGKSGEYSTENKALSIQYNLDKTFDTTIEQQVHQLEETLPNHEIKKRRNFTNITTFTIDPETAQDFDDAISIQTHPNGTHEIGIHIADVTHYVTPDSPLDIEAQKRSTSTYLVDKVIPMLPERLSNHLCSLKPKEARLTFSVVLTFKDTDIIDTWIGETIIYSQKRFTYDEAHQIMQQKQGTFHKELFLLDSIAKKLRKKRLEQNAIDFASDNTKIFIDPVTNTVQIKTITSTTTHQLIEEYMLLANRIIAETITSHHKQNKSKTPFIYRTHEQPKPEKIENFKQFIQSLGYTFDNNQPIQKNLNDILQKSKDTIHQDAVHTLAIRTMEQARYTTDPLGHFGLGFKHYTHFTSPIRRYPDIIIHRLVKHFLSQTQPPQKNYEAIAKHSSQQERIATEAERASINLHQVIYMQKHINKTFKGVISGVTAWGLYVEIIENKCEGLIHISDLTDDYYIFEQTTLSLKGQRTKKTYRLGDSITIRVKACDIQRKNVDFLLV